MIIRNWKFEDILVISELEKACFKGECWSYGALVSAFENPNYCGLVAVEGEEIVGYGCICTVVDSADLENVVVAEEYRRGGIGSALLEALLCDARTKGAEKVFLEVRVSNYAAMSMYLKSGFRGVYARTRYYSDGEDCLVMQKDFRAQ